MLLLLLPENLVDCWLLMDPMTMIVISDKGRHYQKWDLSPSLTQEVTELVEDVQAGRPSLLQQEGGAPGALGQRAEARPQVSRRLLDLLGPSCGGAQEDWEGEEKAGIGGNIRTEEAGNTSQAHLGSMVSTVSHCDDVHHLMLTVILIRDTNKEKSWLSSKLVWLSNKKSQRILTVFPVSRLLSFRILVSLGGNNQDQEVVSRSEPIINEMGQRKLVLELSWTQTI